VAPTGMVGATEDYEGRKSTTSRTLNHFYESCATVTARLGALSPTLNKKIFEEELTLATMQRTTAA
jgi:hypothetical protein